MEDKIAINIREAARITSLSRSSIYEAIRDGRLEKRKLGSRTVLLLDDVKKFLAALPK